MIMSFNIVISKSKLTEMHYCERCKRYYPSPDYAHDCDGLRMRNFIRNRIIKETIKYSLIGFIASFIVFLFIFISLQQKIIIQYSQTINYMENEMKSWSKITEQILKSQDTALWTMNERNK